MSSPNPLCHAYKAYVKVRSDARELDWTRAKEATVGKLSRAIDKLKDGITGTASKVKDAYNDIKEAIKELDIKSPSELFILMFAKLWELGKDAILIGLTAKTLQLLNQDLKDRRAMLLQLKDHIDVIITALNVIEKNLNVVKEDESLITKLRLAAYYVKRAYISCHKLEATYKTYGIFSKSLYNDINTSLEKAQNNLTSRTVQVAEAHIQNYLDDLGVGKFVHTPGLVDFLRSQAVDAGLPVNESSDLFALYDFLDNTFDDRRTAIVISFNLAVEATKEILKLMPYAPTNFDDFVGTTDKTPTTLMSLNADIYFKIIGLQSAGTKFINLSKVVAPFVQYLNEAIMDLRVTYIDMQGTFTNINIKDEYLVTKSETWAKQVGDVQKKLMLVNEDTAAAIGEATTFAQTFNYILDYIKTEYDASNDPGIKLYSELLGSMVAFVTKQGIGQLFNDELPLSSSFISSRRYIDICLKNDLRLSNAINELDLDKYLYELRYADQIYDAADDLFPDIIPVLVNLDLDKIIDAFKDVDEDVDDDTYKAKITSKISKVTSNLKKRINSEIQKRAAECLGEGATDEMLSRHDDSDEEEEIDEQMTHTENFVAANAFIDNSTEQSMS